MGDTAQAKARDLYHAFAKWAEGAGEKPLMETTFGRRMVERGVERQHTRTGKKYLNVGLRLEDNKSVTGYEK